MQLSKRILTLVVAAMILGAAVTVRAQNTIPTQLPDLKGREIVVVDSNDYTPFSFVDPRNGKAVGYEYEMMGEICAPQLQGHVQDWRMARFHDGRKPGSV
jgi:polar amino acid transport system substrate-binding protein